VAAGPHLPLRRASVYSRTPSFGPKATYRKLSLGAHITKDEARSLCGLDVALVDFTNPPSEHNVDCTRCLMTAHKKTR
jgi:hypothetical protein